jgi:hypothetical protein
MLSGAIALTLAGTLTTALPASALIKVTPIVAQSLSQTSGRATSAATMAQAGLEFTGSSTQNVGVIPVKVVITKEPMGVCNSSEFIQTRFLSDISGTSNPSFVTNTSTEEGIITAEFVSNITQPAPGLRVIVRNLTPGMEGEPHSDREYHNGAKSEPLQVRFGKQHDRKYLAVAEGKNTFAYDIKHGDAVVESGSFTAEITRRTNTTTQKVSRLCLPPNNAPSTVIKPPIKIEPTVIKVPPIILPTLTLPKIEPIIPKVPIIPIPKQQIILPRQQPIIPFK